MENTIIARNYKFENKELTKATTAIAKATESAAKSLLKIASVMAEVEARALYADDFKSIAEYGEATAEVVEEEPDEIAMQFLSAKMALDRLVELLDGKCGDGYVPAEEIRNIKERLCGIENALN